MTGKNVPVYPAAEGYPISKNYHSFVCESSRDSTIISGISVCHR